MDIVTHALIGLVTAAPFAEKPELAAGLVIGSVLPDLDVLSRLLGKRAMILCHQGFTHSLLFLALLAVVVSIVFQGGWPAGAGLFLGGLLHVFLDYSNTLGVKLLWPVSSRRFQKSWVFFMDAFVTGAALVALGITIISIRETGTVTAWPSAGFFAALSIYWCAKIYWLGLARRIAGETAVSLVPSALVPWRFLVCSRLGNVVLTACLNAVSGGVTAAQSFTILDEDHARALSSVPEWKMMRDLSPAYHVISRKDSPEGFLLLCRDLRMRNFNSRYGDLELQFDAHGSMVLSKTFHV